MAQTLPGEDLKTEPFWWDAAPRPVLPEDDLPTHLDVAVVGSGYTGLSAALVLARAGRSVAVFESGEVGVGASTRNGGICSGSLKVSFRALERRFGLDKAAAIYGEGKEARAALAAKFEANRHKVFNDLATIRGMEDFFEETVRAPGEATAGSSAAASASRGASCWT